MRPTTCCAVPASGSGTRRSRAPFSIGGDQRIELRAEAINLTNQFNRGNPAATLNNAATFGRITTAQSFPRIWQFAVRYLF